MKTGQSELCLMFYRLCAEVLEKIRKEHADSYPFLLTRVFLHPSPPRLKAILVGDIAIRGLLKQPPSVEHACPVLFEQRWTHPSR